MTEGNGVRRRYATEGDKWDEWDECDEWDEWDEWGEWGAGRVWRLAGVALFEQRSALREKGAFPGLGLMVVFNGSLARLALALFGLGLLG